MNAKTLLLWKWILIALLCLSGWGSMLAQTEPPGYRADRILVMPKPGADLTLLHAQLGAQKLARADEDHRTGLEIEKHRQEPHAILVSPEIRG